VGYVFSSLLGFLLLESSLLISFSHGIPIIPVVCRRLCHRHSLEYIPGDFLSNLVNVISCFASVATRAGPCGGKSSSVAVSRSSCVSFGGGVNQQSWLCVPAQCVECAGSPFLLSPVDNGS
jgi:hypothetical protein